MNEEHDIDNKLDIDDELIIEDDDQEVNSSGSNILVPTKVFPTTLYILPVVDQPFFPAQALPIELSSNIWLETIEKIGSAAHHMAGILLTSAKAAEITTVNDFYSVGTAVRLHNPAHNDNNIQTIAEGRMRFKVIKWISTSIPFIAQVEYIKEQKDVKTNEIKAYSMAIINTIKELVPHNPLYSEEIKFFLERFNLNDPNMLADFAATLTTRDKEALQDILETVALIKRMKKVLVVLKKELEVAKLQGKIHDKVEQQMSEQQRQFFLKEQLKVIQQELGLAKDDRTADSDKFRERLEKLTIPKETLNSINDEMDKLSILETGSPEYAVTRNYLDWITALPWGIFSKDMLNLKNARENLDKDHQGLDDVKNRIIEFLAVGKLKGRISGSIILLVGPPGVGKTSIGKSIAHAIGRKFFRFSLGGMRDEAEIKGHRRTYIGAMPGKFIQSMKDVQTSNPVIMLDEIDKIGNSYQGDPASALLEVLDPEQNNEFLDHYIDNRFDLSNVLFICTANQLDTIPSPLLDRMEIIHLSGYITEEKIQIAKKHLWPKLVDQIGIKRSQIKITTTALRKLIDGYAREAGVRNLEKQLKRIIRKIAVKIVAGKKGPYNIQVDDVETHLGKAVFTNETPISGIGNVTGLAWTSMGGTTLTIEAAHVHSKNKGFKLTGQLGDVMKESAEIAYSFIFSNLETFKANKSFFDSSFIHLHVPEGATPKDGPSAGVTMATALLSLARNTKPKSGIAMTGELTLTGRVLPVGGIREKVIAARRIKIKELILPFANKHDFDELPDYIQKGMKVHFAEQYSDVFAIMFKPIK
ncbi:ATP-dependent protease La Type I [hydrothermal vent metagenome]|uniref:endopeptidase La n=1 Tax=hydrothermal vent metagenome TaxID=652676 RepID=A0A3B1AXU3_9ZZZZ